MAPTSEKLGSPGRALERRQDATTCGAKGAGCAVTPRAKARLKDRRVDRLLFGTMAEDKTCPAHDSFYDFPTDNLAAFQQSPEDPVVDGTILNNTLREWKVAKRLLPS